MKSFFIILLLTSCSLFTAQSSTTPILNDGSPTVIQEFRIPTSGEKIITKLDLDLTGTTEVSDIAEITLTHIRRGSQHA